MTDTNDFEIEEVIGQNELTAAQNVIPGLTFEIGQESFVLYDNWEETGELKSIIDKSQEIRLVVERLNDDTMKVLFVILRDYENGDTFHFSELSLSCYAVGEVDTQDQVDGISEQQGFPYSDIVCDFLPRVKDSILLATLVLTGVNFAKILQNCSKASAFSLYNSWVIDDEFADLESPNTNLLSITLRNFWRRKEEGMPGHDEFCQELPRYFVSNLREVVAISIEGYPLNLVKVGMLKALDQTIWDLKIKLENYNREFTYVKRPKPDESVNFETTEERIKAITKYSFTDPGQEQECREMDPDFHKSDPSESDRDSNGNDSY